MATRKKPRANSKKKPSEPKMVLDVELLTPEVFFAVEKAFQDQGITLVDLATGTPIDGQINALDIGMIHPDTPTTKAKPGFGFIPSVKQEQLKKRDVDAVLCQHPEAGFQSSTPVLIKVVRDEDMSKWLVLLSQIAGNFPVKSGRKNICAVAFSITSLSKSNGPDGSATTAVLRTVQGYGFGSASGVSNTEIDLDYLDEEDDEDTY